jgi:predicted  nucleic acid-binding Zn-ribbon protein
VTPAQGKDEDDDGIVKDLKKEVQTLKGRCNEHERIIKDLQSRCETHENVLEMLRQEIVGLHDSRKTLDTTYLGNSYDLEP